MADLEELAGRAREVLAAEYELAGMPIEARNLRRGDDPFSLEEDCALKVIGHLLSDEGSGIGELLSAIDAWIADGTPETEQGILDARAGLSQSS